MDTTCHAGGACHYLPSSFSPAADVATFLSALTTAGSYLVAAYRLLALGGNLMKNLLDDPKVYLEGGGEPKTKATSR